MENLLIIFSLLCKAKNLTEESVARKLHLELKVFRYKLNASVKKPDEQFLKRLAKCLNFPYPVFAVHSAGKEYFKNSPFMGMYDPLKCLTGRYYPELSGIPYDEKALKQSLTSNEGNDFSF